MNGYLYSFRSPLRLSLLYLLCCLISPCAIQLTYKVLIFSFGSNVRNLHAIFGCLKQRVVSLLSILPQFTNKKATSSGPKGPKAVLETLINNPQTKFIQHSTTSSDDECHNPKTDCHARIGHTKGHH